MTSGSRKCGVSGLGDDSGVWIVVKGETGAGSIGTSGSRKCGVSGLGDDSGV